MTKKTQISFVWRIAALAALFAFTTTIAFAAPYRFHYFQPNGGNTYWYPASSNAWYPNGEPANVQQSAPDGRTYQALATPTAPMGTFSGGADYLSSVTGQGTYHWDMSKLPIKVYISSGENVPSYRPQFGDYIRHGFDEWCRVSNGKLAWVEVNDPSKADITVKWTNQVTQRPEGTEAGKTDALTRYNTVTHQGIIYGARMQFLTRLPQREFSDLEVAKTCLHEAGHAMGLQGHSPYRNDIMYYAVQPTQPAVLSQRDINTLTHLYADCPVFDAVAMKAKHPVESQFAAGAQQ